MDHGGLRSPGGRTLCPRKARGDSIEAGELELGVGGEGRI